MGLGTLLWSVRKLYNLVFLQFNVHEKSGECYFNFQSLCNREFIWYLLYAKPCVMENKETQYKLSALERLSPSAGQGLKRRGSDGSQARC